MCTLREAWSALLVVALVLMISRVSWGDELAEFEKGRNSYDLGRYDEAAQRFAEMLGSDSEDRLTSPLLVEQARMYLSASLIALRRWSEADAEFEAILRNNPSAEPDKVMFQVEVLNRFADVRARIRQELEAQTRAQAEQERQRTEQEMARQQRERDRVAMLERLAQEEVHVVHNRRWIAAIPFGVGQFQNDQAAYAWTFLITEAALATTTVVTSAIVQELQVKGTAQNVDTVSLNRRVSDMKTVNHLAFTAFVAAAISGVVHAQWTFVPTRQEVRQRPLPIEIRPAPSVTAVRGGAMLGVNGSF